MTGLKTTKLALLCGAALLVAPGIAMAEPAVSGDIAVYGGTLAVYNDSYGDNFTDGAVVGVNGRMKFDMMQLDVNVEYVNASLGYDYTTKGAAVHVMTQDADRSIGVMVGIGDDGAGDATVGGAPYYTFAVEGMTRLGGTTFDTQFGYILPDDNDYYIDSGFYAYLGTSTPLSQNLDLNMHVRGAWLAESGTHDYSYVKAVSYGAMLEYAASDRLTLFGGYVGSFETERSESEKWNTSSVQVGLRVPFGAPDSSLVFADHNPLTGVNHLRLSDWQ